MYYLQRKMCSVVSRSLFSHIITNRSRCCFLLNDFLKSDISNYCRKSKTGNQGECYDPQRNT